GVAVIPWSPLARGRLTRPWGETTARLVSDDVGKNLYDESDKNMDFPRLEIVLEGELTDMSITAPLIPCDVLYVPAGGWNIPQWQT
ncbi:hypothetical protein ONO39_26200, partial [Salmonella enterica subsp. enterica serovar Anatum]|nr:hypothetical protein [Salmonella enterica subsp. enterica serovar Anatum]